MTHPATDLRTSLRIAASTSRLASAGDAGRAAATDRQIDMIVALARGSNDYSVEPGSRLTSREASQIIDAMLAAGAVADYDVTDGELDDQDQAAAMIAERRADLKAHKAHDKAAKAHREAQKLEAAKASATGRKVRHNKFGEGDVIGEDETTVTAIFAGQKKAMKLLKTFVVAI